MDINGYAEMAKKIFKQSRGVVSVENNDTICITLEVIRPEPRVSEIFDNGMDNVPYYGIKEFKYLLSMADSLEFKLHGTKYCCRMKMRIMNMLPNGDENVKFKYGHLTKEQLKHREDVSARIEPFITENEEFLAENFQKWLSGEAEEKYIKKHVHEEKWERFQRIGKLAYKIFEGTDFQFEPVESESDCEDDDICSYIYYPTECDESILFEGERFELFKQALGESDYFAVSFRENKFREVCKRFEISFGIFAMRY